MTLAELNAAAGVEESPYRWRATRRTQISTPDSTKRASRQAERRAQAVRNTANDEAVELAAAKQEDVQDKQEDVQEQSAEIAAPAEQEVAPVEEANDVDQTGMLLAEHGSTMILNPFAVPETAQAVLAQAVAKKQEPARRAAAADPEADADADDVTSRRRRRR
ncbi:MAG: ribonuclease E/G, partial [Glutamicibacter sp.]